MMNMDLGTLLALGAAAAGVAIIVLIAIYIYAALALMAIAKKTNTEPAWLAWIPLVNLILLAMVAKQKWWIGLIVVILMFIPYVQILAYIGLLWFWIEASGACGKNKWLGLLMIIPIVNLVWMGILAWGK